MLSSNLIIQMLVIFRWLQGHEFFYDAELVIQQDAPSSITRIKLANTIFFTKFTYFNYEALVLMLHCRS